MTKEAKLTNEKPKKAMLFSRLNYAVEVKYKGETAVVSPNAKINIEDVSQLDRNLPKGLILRLL